VSASAMDLHDRIVSLLEGPTVHHRDQLLRRCRLSAHCGSLSPEAAAGAAATPFGGGGGGGITSGGGLDVGDADDACPVTACSRAPLLRLGTDLILLALARCGAGQPSAGVASGLTIAASGVRPELPGTSTVGLGISEATFKFKDEEAAMENENFFQKRQRPRQRLGKEDESLFKDQATHVPAGADAISEAHAWASVVLAKEACRSLDAPEVEASVSQLARLLLEPTLRALRPAMAGALLEVKMNE
jgi:hypothetical protein